MDYYYILVLIDITNGILTPEKFLAAKNKIPKGYTTSKEQPQISLTINKAELIYKCTKNDNKSVAQKGQQAKLDMAKQGKTVQKKIVSLPM